RVGRPEYRQVERRIGAGEIDHGFSLWVLAQAGDHQVDLAGGEKGNTVGAVDRGQGQLDAELVGQQLRGVDVQPTGREVWAYRAEGREVLGHGQCQHATGSDVGQGVGLGLGQGQSATAEQGGQEQRAEVFHGNASQVSTEVACPGQCT